MPGGDGTGPEGLGPMTGRGLGYCTGYNRPGYASPRFGRGWFGRGRGWGRGYYARPARGFWQNYPYAAPSASGEEVDVLKDEADALKEELKAIEARIKDLGTKKKK